MKNYQNIFVRSNKQLKLSFSLFNFSLSFLLVEWKIMHFILFKDYERKYVHAKEEIKLSVFFSPHRSNIKYIDNINVTENKNPTAGYINTYNVWTGIHNVDTALLKKELLMHFYWYDFDVPHLLLISCSIDHIIHDHKILFWSIF